MNKIWVKREWNNFKPNDTIRRNTLPDIVCRVVSIFRGTMIVEYNHAYFTVLSTYEDTEQFYYEREEEIKDEQTNKDF